jgi:tRNA modification GTPase
VFNKCDLLSPADRAALSRDAAGPGINPRVHLSAATGEGLDTLREHLKQAAGWTGEGEGAVSARARHLDALLRAHDHAERARAQLARRSGELAAEELRLAQQALGEITGEFTSDELLGEIFGSFCIGK